MKAFKAIVRGRVQMVMYRDFAQRKARAHGVVGTVRNLDDGTVEVIAEGEEPVLKEYIELLKKGSMLSHVEKVEVAWQYPTRAYSNFSIVY